MSAEMVQAAAATTWALDALMAVTDHDTVRRHLDDLAIADPPVYAAVVEAFSPELADDLFDEVAR